MSGGSLMEQDMAAQPAVLAALAGRRDEIIESLAGPAPVGIVVVARGSSDHAGIFGRYLLEAATGLPVALAAPSLQTLYGVPPRVDGWLAVGISQSGRTPEIATVLERFRDGGARAVAVTNEPDSPLARGAAVHVSLGAGEERAVPATKTFTAQLAAMALMAEALGPVPFGAGDWHGLPAVVEEVLEDAAPVERVAAELRRVDELACVGRGYLMCVALEAALKLREAAGLRAEGWSAADFRHGPLTVAGPGLPTLAVSAAGPAAADVAELAEQLAVGGAPVLRMSDDARADIPFPSGVPEPLAAIPATVRAQQLALALAQLRGVDPDRPPGLAKVTRTA
jgi:glucosamine--fructose-6-phosphate aminotransferase (isomerizing)